eukprot:372981_1
MLQSYLLMGVIVFTVYYGYKLVCKNDKDAVGSIHKSLAWVNRALIGGLVPGIQKHNKQATNNLLPKDIVSVPSLLHKDSEYPLNLPKSNVFGVAVLKNDDYVHRNKLKDVVFSLI